MSILVLYALEKYFSLFNIATVLMLLMTSLVI